MVQEVLQEINNAKVQANTMHIVCHDRDNFWFPVTEFDRSHQGITVGQYRVHLRNKTCDCGRFDALCYLCAHRHVFPLIPDEDKWSSISLALFKLLPDRELHHKPKGRPCSTRIRNNMDIRKITNQ
ncbi:hypothetical protein J1N35_010614 [Gossypium stocksii]|uniref:SWIM-type domain-containing protein n=1 Tax=Gossypium stocksii TaxID=47602 RepID=A0A9D4ACW2_9ROSI|nr:hypothetical protein J1N35_010614 [Gossypium stocksii]